MTREEIIEQLDSIIGTYEILMGNGVNSDILDVDDIEAIREAISALSENKGEWIYDKGIYNWRCSRCNQTPPPTGYVGKAEFMATHFKFCPNCGADMKGGE